MKSSRPLRQDLKLCTKKNENEVLAPSSWRTNCSTQDGKGTCRRTPTSLYRTSGASNFGDERWDSDCFESSFPLPSPITAHLPAVSCWPVCSVWLLGIFRFFVEPSVNSLPSALELTKELMLPSWSESYGPSSSRLCIAVARTDDEELSKEERGRLSFCL